MGGNGFTDREAGQIENRLDHHEEKLDEILDKMDETYGELSDEVQSNTFFRRIGTWVSLTIIVPLLLTIISLLIRSQML